MITYNEIISLDQGGYTIDTQGTFIGTNGTTIESYHECESITIGLSTVSNLNGISEVGQTASISEGSIFIGSVSDSGIITNTVLGTTTFSATDSDSSTDMGFTSTTYLTKSEFGYETTDFSIEGYTYLSSYSSTRTQTGPTSTTTFSSTTAETSTYSQIVASGVLTARNVTLFTLTTYQSTYFNTANAVVYIPQGNEVLWSYLGTVTTRCSIGTVNMASFTDAVTVFPQNAVSVNYDGATAGSFEATSVGTTTSSSFTALTTIGLNSIFNGIGAGGGLMSYTSNVTSYVLTTETITSATSNPLTYRQKTTVSSTTISSSISTGTTTALTTATATISIASYSIQFIGTTTTASLGTVDLMATVALPGGPIAGGNYATTEISTTETTVTTLTTWEQYGQWASTVTGSSFTNQTQVVVDSTRFDIGQFFFDGTNGGARLFKKLPNKGWRIPEEGSLYNQASLGGFQPGSNEAGLIYGLAQMTPMFYPQSITQTWYDSSSSISYTASWDDSSNLHLTTASTHLVGSNTSTSTGTATASWEGAEPNLETLFEVTGGADIFIGSGGYETSWLSPSTIFQGVGVYARSSGYETVTAGTSNTFSTADFCRSMPFATVEVGAITWETRGA